MEQRKGFVSDKMLARMAAALGVTERASIDALGAWLDTALTEIAAQREVPSPTPRELQETFDQVYRRAKELREALASLGSEERRIVDEMSEDVPRPLFSTPKVTNWPGRSA